jgi:E3 ubiquitin-protein ligase synoviolin
VVVAEMIRLQTYVAFSLLAMMSVVYYAFSSQEQFYPAMVYLSNFKIYFMLLLNTSLVAMCATWQLIKRIFLCTLREAEVEHLNEQSWREVVNILFAITIFRQDFSVTFLAMVAALLLVKALNWVAQKRVEYIETTPSVPLLSHVRIVSFMAFIQKTEASVTIFFSFE